MRHDNPRFLGERFSTLFSHRRPDRLRPELEQAADVMRTHVMPAVETAVIKGGRPFAAVVFDVEGKMQTFHNEVGPSGDGAHAENLATIKLNPSELRGSTMYVNCAPCEMCMSNILKSHIKLLYYGPPSEKGGHFASPPEKVLRKAKRRGYPTDLVIVGGVLQEELGEQFTVLDKIAKSKSEQVQLKRDESPLGQSIQDTYHLDGIYAPIQRADDIQFRLCMKNGNLYVRFSNGKVVVYEEDQVRNAGNGDHDMGLQIVAQLYHDAVPSQVSLAAKNLLLPYPQLLQESLSSRSPQDDDMLYRL